MERTPQQILFGGLKESVHVRVSWDDINLSKEISGLDCWAQRANHVGQRQNISKFIKEPAL